MIAAAVRAVMSTPRQGLGRLRLLRLVLIMILMFVTGLVFIGMGWRMRRPDLRISCCLCTKPVPRAAEVYALDDEWQRRFPGLRGYLACPRCVLGRYTWSCRDRSGRFLPGHIPSATVPPVGDDGSWSHFTSHGTHASQAVRHPRSALVQGAEPYLLWLAEHPRYRSSTTVARIRMILQDPAVLMPEANAAGGGPIAR